MGGCFSDVRGGKEAVGGNRCDPTTMGSSGGGGSHNDAVDLLFRTHGFQGLFTQLEMLKLDEQDFLVEATCALSEAIFEVGEVIQFYDSDKLFPAWGFGGRPIDGVVSHCFNLNGSPSEFEVEGINGIMSA